MRFLLAASAGALFLSTPVAVSAQSNPFGDPAVLDAECTAGNLESCSKLANHLVTRKDEASKRRGFELHKSTCDKGHLPACGDLAASYSMGLGVEKDEARAYEINLKLCEEKDYGPACSSVGFVHALGKAGFARDENSAVIYFERACELDHAGGCERAGKHWNSLLNPDRDKALAAQFFSRGCELGNANACSDLRGLRAE
tara:strand:- start:557 stop:1156 length:600 start_codon:yes stop_codon:yes gene_type:complete